MGLMQELYRYGDDGKKTDVNAKLKEELTSFAKRWFKISRIRDFSTRPPSGSGSPDPLPFHSHRH